MPAATGQTAPIRNNASPGLKFSKGAKRCCIVANFSEEVQVLMEQAGMGGKVRVKSLDEHSS